MNVPSAMTDFHLYVNTAASGDGSGRDPNNYITLADAVTMIQAVNPANATLYLYSATETPGGGFTGSTTYSTACDL